MKTWTTLLFTSLLNKQSDRSLFFVPKMITKFLESRILLAFVPSSWEVTFIPWNFPSDTSVFLIHGGSLRPNLFMLMRWLRMWTIHNRKNKHVVRDLGLWAMWYHPDLQEEEKPGDWIQPYRQWFNQSYLYNETLRKTQNTDVWVIFLGWQYSAYCHMLMCPKANTSWGQGSCIFWTFPDYLLCNSPLVWFCFVLL